MAGIGGGPII